MSLVMGISLSRKWLVFALLYTFVIYISLPFGRFIVNTMYSLLGKDTLSFVVNLLLIAVAVYVIYKFKNNLRNLILIGIGLGLVFIFASGMERPEERMHFIQYGLLGFLMLKVFSGALYKVIILSAIFVFLAGAVDEIIQYFLPNRVGDIRDVIFNTLGGLLGIWVGYFYFYSR